MKGVEVLVRRPVATGDVDELGNLVRAWSEPKPVHDVLVSREVPQQVLESNRPDGMTARLVLAWPKSDHSSLRGCQVKVPGDENWYSVLGDPLPQVDGQMARPYNKRDRAVYAGRDDG